MSYPPIGVDPRLIVTKRKAQARRREKLTKDLVKAYKSGATNYEQLAEKFGSSRAQVYKILKSCGLVKTNYFRAKGSATKALKITLDEYLCELIEATGEPASKVVCDALIEYFEINEQNVADEEK